MKTEKQRSLASKAVRGHRPVCRLSICLAASLHIKTDGLSRVDPDQLRNVAGHPDYAEPMKQLIVQLMTKLKATRDPRVLGKGDEIFDLTPYFGGPPKFRK